MDKKFLIVGHGLAGCTLALTLYRRQLPFKLIGTSIHGEASMASSGLIAPITGRRYVKAWRIEELLAKALDFYHWTETIFGGKYFFPVEIVRFLKNDEAIIAWNKRLLDPEYSEFITNKKYDFLNRIDRPYGILAGGYRLDTPGWLTAAREYLIQKGLLEIWPLPYDVNSSQNDIVVFATGSVDPGVSGGIIPNKGEALVVRMPEWQIPLIIKEEVFIVPLKEKDLFWVGSYYNPWPTNALPSLEGRTQLLQSIRKVYSGELEVVEHLCGVRPTVDDRRPLIGSYPGHPHQYFFNGMGTKGTSLAPFWADQLLSHIIDGLPLPDEVLPARYIKLV